MKPESFYCEHHGIDNHYNPDYKFCYCDDTDEFFCLVCGWIADLQEYHEHVCREPERCKSNAEGRKTS